MNVILHSMLYKLEVRNASLTLRRRQAFFEFDSVGTYDTMRLVYDSALELCFQWVLDNTKRQRDVTADDYDTLVAASEQMKKTLCHGLLGQNKKRDPRRGEESRDTGSRVRRRYSWIPADTLMHHVRRIQWHIAFFFLLLLTRVISATI